MGAGREELVISRNPTKKCEKNKEHRNCRPVRCSWFSQVTVVRNGLVRRPFYFRTPVNRLEFVSS